MMIKDIQCITFVMNLADLYSTPQTLSPSPSSSSSPESRVMWVESESESRVTKVESESEPESLKKIKQKKKT